MNNRFRSFCLFFLFIGVIAKGGREWQQNQTAITVTSHLSVTDSCAIDQAHLQWRSSSLESLESPYLQAVVASALYTDIPSPSITEWERDPRFYHWFMAQTKIKNKLYDESLAQLTKANAGPTLEATGHWSETEACRLINWTIASEIGYGEPPNGYVQHLMNQGQYEDVIEAFTRLLSYDPNRSIWRISLAKAYLAIGNKAEAEETLSSVFQNGTAEEIETASTLLQASQ